MKGLPRSLSRGINGGAGSNKTIVLNNLAITTTGATGVGYGTAVIRGLPQGNILFLGVVAYLQLTKLSAGTIATFDGDFSLGTAPTADATLAGSEVDIVPSTPLNPATAGVSPLVRATNATQAIFDNTDGSLEINLNLLIDDASVSADAQNFVANGAVFIAYQVLGDD